MSTDHIEHKTKLWAERVRSEQPDGAPAIVPTWETPTRDQVRSGRPRRARATTIGMKKLRSLRGNAEPPEDVSDFDPRPKTRAGCGEERPCPYVSCAHHTFLDVNRSGGMKLNFPDLEVWEVAETCVLDAAERGGLPGTGMGEGTTLEGVAEVLNLTRERVRQLETRALNKVRRKAVELAVFAEDEGYGRKARHLPMAPADADDTEDEDE